MTLRSLAAGPMRFLLVLVLSASCVPSAVAAPVRITDDHGVTTNLPTPPKRIVTLLPSLAEMVCAFGECARLVGVDRYTNWPAATRQLPKVGGGLDANVEAIVALRPDVVLAATSTRVSTRLSALGLKVVSLEPKNLAQVQRTLRQVGELLAVPDPDLVWRREQAKVVAATASLQTAAKGLKVYVEVSDGPWGASDASYVGEVLTRLGGVNILPASMGPFPQVNPEWVVSAQPDVIILAAGSSRALTQRPGWSALPVVKNGLACELSGEQMDVLVRPGARMGEAAQLMADCLNKVAADRVRRSRP